MKSVLMGAAGAVFVAIVAIFIFDYGGSPSADRFAVPDTTRLD